LACNQSRRAQDARADGAANDDRNAEADAENAQQVPFWGGGRLVVGVIRAGDYSLCTGLESETNLNGLPATEPKPPRCMKECTAAKPSACRAI